MERLTESKTAQTAGILAVGSLAAAAWLALEAHGRGVSPGFQPLLFAALGPSLGFAVWWMGRPKDVPRGPAGHAPDASSRAALEQAMSDVREEIARHLAASEAHVASQRAALDELVATAPEQDAADDLWARAEALMVGRSPETPPPAVAAAGSETSIVEGLRDTIGSMEDLAGSIREAADGIDALSLIAEETSSAVHEMDAMFEQVKTNAADTLELTERVSAGAGRATRLLRAAEDELQRARSGGNQARAVVSGLGRRLAALQGPLESLVALADRAELAALNASILAARAGDDGGDLAALAAGLSALSAQTAHGVAQLTERLEALQDEARLGLPPVGREASAQGGVSAEALAGLGAELGVLLDVSVGVGDRVRATLRATEEQADGSAAITDAVGRIAEAAQQLAGVTEEQARGASLVLASAERVRAGAQTWAEEAASVAASSAPAEDLPGPSLDALLRDAREAHRRERSVRTDARQRLEAALEAQRRDLEVLRRAVERLGPPKA